ncbi:hypothetical protein [Halocynthiibacter styelae]|uniref:Uncharacterized protein n=1 Tax=Halocynthiibacter styelae TaxID=2761955 RepID=A0A8J7IYR4_9RHOB|nr:hypothetical protein [Paenihalocynthiibacter styelae]MBI1495378.1 hypothetical protein [Paenihalocynthiibacter styelae]
MSDHNIIDLSKHREERALLADRGLTPDGGELQDICPLGVALRVLDDEMNGKPLSLTYNEIIAMVMGLDQTFDVLNRLCSKKRLNKGDLHFLFEAMQSPLTSIERFKNDTAG